MPRKTRTITAATKHKLPRPKKKAKPAKVPFGEDTGDRLGVSGPAVWEGPRPKRKRPKATPSPLTSTPPGLGSQPAPTFDYVAIPSPTTTGGTVPQTTATLCHDWPIPDTQPVPWDAYEGWMQLRRRLADRLIRLAQWVRPKEVST